jgi:hypothetical protein
MISALQRNTIHNALTHLSPEERQAVTLAYLEGRTNRQIAAVLGVSVSTVKRRLSFALEHVDDYIRRSGTWVSSILLLGALSIIGRAARLRGIANTAASADWPHKLTATVAAGMVTAAGVGLIAAHVDSSTSPHSSPPASARLIPNLPATTRTALNKTVAPLTPSSAAPSAPVAAAVPPAPKTKALLSTTNAQQTQIGKVGADTDTEQPKDADDEDGSQAIPSQAIPGRARPEKRTDTKPNVSQHLDDR